MATFTASARQLAGSLEHVVDVNGRHTIVTDEPEHLGGGDAGPTPHELLAAAVASCVSTMIALYAQRKGWVLDDLSVDVTYDSGSEPRHVDVEVHLPTSLSDEQIERLRHVARTCPVVRALETGFTVDEQLTVDALAV